jgi:arginine deiminase
LSEDRFALRPLHNFFFTRDPAFTIGQEIFISQMAKPVRARESIILENIFRHHPRFKGCHVVNLHALSKNAHSSIEGGDIQVVNDKVLLAGLGVRTNSAGIDALVEHFKKKKEKKDIIVQVLPKAPESFIHLDMVFTVLGKGECLVYEPFLKSRFRTIRISIDQGEVKISEVVNILEGLRQVGLDLEPAYCGGRDDSWVQEREQWHSGANFLSFGPGQVIGYARNNYTFDELSSIGYQVIPAREMINGGKVLRRDEKVAIALDGSELPRGGGGARCMSMPLNRL